MAGFDIAGTVLEDATIAARASWSRVVEAGQRLRIIDLEGRQAVDFLCYNAHDHADRYAAADTMKINARGIFLGIGTTLYSVGLTPLLTVVEDTCGRHDTIGGCCSNAVNAFRYGAAPGPNCRDNFLRELAGHGMGAADIVANVNFFMYVPVAETGEMDMGPGISSPGDYVELLAETDTLAVISNCPQINNPVNDYNPTPIRVIVWTPAQGA